MQLVKIAQLHRDYEIPARSELIIWVYYAWFCMSSFCLSSHHSFIELCAIKNVKVSILNLLLKWLCNCVWGILLYSIGCNLHFSTYSKNFWQESSIYSTLLWGILICGLFKFCVTVNFISFRALYFLMWDDLVAIYLLRIGSVAFHRW
jgi:hypothetical protein